MNNIFSSESWLKILSLPWQYATSVILVLFSTKMVDWVNEKEKREEWERKERKNKKISQLIEIECFLTASATEFVKIKTLLLTCEKKTLKSTTTRILSTTMLPRIISLKINYNY